MGILNVTPDSFSDGGKYSAVEAAIGHALVMEAEGADLIDIGGESTRPGAELVTAEVEASRVLPVLEGLRGRLRIPISIDTTKSEVAREAVGLGAEMINDVSGLRFDSALASVAAGSGAALVLMHSRGRPANMQQLPPMVDLLGEVIAGLRESIGIALACGVAREKLIIDPGIGFGKTPEQNLALINRLDLLAEACGRPLLLGASRKSFHRLSLERLLRKDQFDLIDPQSANAASLIIGLLRGARIVRVHNVAETVAQVRLAEAILTSR